MSVSPRQPGGSVFELGLHGAAEAEYEVGPIESVYLAMRDGVKLALDVARPADDAHETKRDTILVMTRYWRGIKGESSNEYADRFVPRGFAVVVGDVRGTGASFGEWRHHTSRAETEDFSEVLDWIAAQPWSTGRVVGYGMSYTADTAQWMPERNHPALAGVIPRFPDYDLYEDCYFPGGICHERMAKGSCKRQTELNRNVDFSSTKDRPQSSAGVRPVGPDGEAELKEALRAHESVPSCWPGGFQQVTFKDDRPESWAGVSMLDWSVQEVADRVARAGTPIQTWGGWFDGGTAQGVIRSFIALSNPMNVIIGPWNHGGGNSYDPLGVSGKQISPSPAAQDAIDIRFAEACFNGAAHREQGKVLHYYTLGEGMWKSTSSWPPAATRRRWYMAEGSMLAMSADRGGVDSFQVDRAAREVDANRWETQMEGGKVDYGDRREFDAARLAYTSEALAHPTEITGHPTVHLRVTSSREDGIFFVYLEAVRPDGESRYLTEGQLRAIHRKVWTDSPFNTLGPQHSYLERDSEPLTPGEPATLEFAMHPISVRVPAGHRLRVCLAGSAKPMFANVPADGAPPHLDMHRGPDGCYVELPIIEA